MKRKKKTDEVSEDLYCGKTKAEVRKAYFDGALKPLFADIQSSGEWTEGDIDGLGSLIETFRTSEASFVERVKLNLSEIPNELAAEAKPPSVDELMEGVSDSDWREKADKAVGYVNATLTEVRRSIVEKRKIPADFWLEQAAIFLSLLEIIDKETVYREQQFRKAITEMIQNNGLSRKESEEYARLTPAYSAYKNCTLLRERVDEFIRIAKKEDAKTGSSY